MQSWYVVVAKQNQDHLAARGLREQGFADVYLPKTFEKRRTDSGHRPVGAWLLSPYFFVMLDAALGEHGPIRNTRGVEEILCDPSGRPTPLHDGFGVVSRMRQAEDDEMFAASVYAKIGRTDLKRGMLVRVDKPGFEIRNPDGQFAPLQGRIVAFSRRKVEIYYGVSTIILDENDVSEVK